MAKTAKSLRYLLIGIIFMSFYQIKPSINRYIVIKSEFEQDTILIVARLSQSDTIIIDTFFNSLTHCEYSYTLENDTLYLYYESLCEYDPNANARFVINLKVYKIEHDRLSNIYGERRSLYRKHLNVSYGFIKNHSFCIKCTSGSVTCDSLHTVNLDMIKKLLDSCN